MVLARGGTAARRTVAASCAQRPGAAPGRPQHRPAGDPARVHARSTQRRQGRSVVELSRVACARRGCALRRVDSSVPSGHGAMKARLAFTAALIAASLAAIAGAQTQTSTFSTKIEAVRVDVLVTDRGQPVRGLGPDDFEIQDNGVPQQVDLVSFDQIPLNVILA